MAEETVRTKLGQRVRVLRQERAWTQEELSAATGLHVTYLSTIEHGHRNPSLDVLESLANGFEISICELFKGI